MSFHSANPSFMPVLFLLLSKKSSSRSISWGLKHWAVYIPILCKYKTEIVSKFLFEINCYLIAIESSIFHFNVRDESWMLDFRTACSTRNDSTSRFYSISLLNDAMIDLKLKDGRILTQLIYGMLHSLCSKTVEISWYRLDYPAALTFGVLKLKQAA